jgi:hypothetical protein
MDAAFCPLVPRRQGWPDAAFQYAPALAERRLQHRSERFQMSKTSKTTQENKPPAWAAPLFVKSAQDAQKLYDTGTGGNTFMGSTVAPLSATTMQGVNQLAQAGQGWDTSGARPIYQGIGAAAVSNPFMGALGDLAAGGTLGDYASGKFLAEGNPHYRQRLDRQIADANAMIQSQFSGAGRYGSGADQRTIADNTSNMLLQGLEDDYNRQQANQFAALNLQGNLLGNAGGLYSTGIGQAQGAADAMANLDQRNFDNRLTGANATLQAGNLLDTQAQKLFSDKVNRWYAKDNEDWTRLGMLQQAAAGAAGPYGTQIATSRQPVGIGGILSGFASLAGKGG